MSGPLELISIFHRLKKKVIRQILVLLLGVHFNKACGEEYI